jgi:hypothetical protein
MIRAWVRKVVDRVAGGSVVRRLSAENIYQRLDAAEGHLRALRGDDSEHEKNVRRLRSHTLGEREIAALGFLSPQDPVGMSFVRVGGRYDGGYVMVEPLLDGTVAYSLGIGNDVSWDRAMAERGYDVFQYDDTIDAPPDDHPKFHFTRRGISSEGEANGSRTSLAKLIDANGHGALRDIVLKVDIEGAEWGVFATLPDEVFACFSQIAVEFHKIDKFDRDDLYRDAMRALRALDRHFVPVHVHGNNYGDFVLLGGVPVPPTLEVTFVRRDLVTTAPCTRVFPTALDSPNWPEHPDLFLGSFQFRR